MGLCLGYFGARGFRLRMCNLGLFSGGAEGISNSGTACLCSVMLIFLLKKVN